MNKKIMGVLFAVFAFIAPSASFAATLNGDPQDFATLRVFNYTDAPTCTTCWSSSAVATSDDIVNFAIYYHNSGTGTATNVRIKLTPKNTTSGTTHTFVATVSADNAPTVTGTAFVTTSIGKSLSFMRNGVLWRPNQTVNGSSPIPFGQSADDIFSGSGINLGNIETGWRTQGSVIVKFQVSSQNNSNTPSTSNSSAPFVSTNSASSVSQNSVVLNGNVTPNGANTNAWFEWGSTPSLGNTTQSLSFGTSASSLISTLFNLSPNTTYYYRAVAQNSNGITQGSIFSFTTLAQFNNSVNSQPFVSTNSASSVSQNSATLNGYVSPNGSNTNAWFEWGTTASLGNTTSPINYGTNASNLSTTLFNINSNTTYYFRAVAQNSFGTVYGSILSFTTIGSPVNNNPVYSQPFVSTNSASSVSQNSATLNGYVSPNGSNTNAWFEWGTNTNFGNTTPLQNYGTNASSLNSTLFNLAPNTTYYYRTVAQGLYGNVYGGTMSFTTSGFTQTNNIVIGNAPTATTLLATEITNNSAKLNGLVFAGSNQPSSAWFEWGASVNLGNRTQAFNIGSLPVVRHADSIAGLVSEQTYYYRVVAENTYGKVFGAISTFVAEERVVVTTPVVNTVTRPVIVRQTINTAPRNNTVVTQTRSNIEAQSPVALSIEGGAEMIGSGEKRTYKVSWKNESKEVLKNVVLRVVFPKSMNIESATNGEFSKEDNSVILDLRALAPGDSSDTFIFTTLGRGVKGGETLVVAAYMVFTGEKGVQGDVVAYVVHLVEATQTNISANVLNAGEFIPTTLFEWILLMILVLILVLLGNHLYGRISGGKH